MMCANLYVSDELNLYLIKYKEAAIDKYGKYIELNEIRKQTILASGWTQSYVDPIIYAGLG